MDKLINAVRITDKLIDYRDTAKRCFADIYEERIATFSAVLQKSMDSHKCNSIEALAIMLKIMQTSGGDTALAQMWLIAACVEMSERASKEITLLPKEVV